MKDKMLIKIKKPMAVLLLIFGALLISCSIDNTEEISSIQLSDTDVFIQTATKFSLKATITPTNSVKGEVKWSTSSASVATVDNYGNVTAVSPGIATITAVCGKMRATCAVTVARNVSITYNDNNVK